MIHQKSIVILISLSDIRILDILDIVIVAYLIFMLYKLLRGTMAMNIFMGVVLFYLVYLLVDFLEMPLLKTVLGTFVSIGFLILVIIFQPEVRRFLLLTGNNMKGRLKFLDNYFGWSKSSKSYENEASVNEILKAVEKLAKTRTGALLVLTDEFGWRNYASNGIELNANVDSNLIESIFFKNSPLHDGAAIIAGDKILAASCVLPISQNKTISQDLGLRHRAALGITENTSALALLVSEETGNISIARDGKLMDSLSTDQLKNELLKKLH